MKNEANDWSSRLECVEEVQIDLKLVYSNSAYIYHDRDAWEVRKASPAPPLFRLKICRRVSVHILMKLLKAEKGAKLSVR